MQQTKPDDAAAKKRRDAAKGAQVLGILTVAVALGLVAVWVGVAFVGVSLIVIGVLAELRG